MSNKKGKIYMEAKEFKFRYPPLIYSRYGFVVYVTAEENEIINRFLKESYWQLRAAFAGKGLVFHYLSEEIKNRYEVTDRDCETTTQMALNDFNGYEDSMFMDYLYRHINEVRRESDSELTRYLDDSQAGIVIKPSLFFCDNRTYQKTTGEVTLKSVAFNPDEDMNAQSMHMVEFISGFFPDGSLGRMHITESDAVSTQHVADSWERLYRDTRSEGFSDEQIKNVLKRIIVRHSISSRIVITRDYRIILEEFGGRELMLKALPKALYLFYLRHPEGVRRNDLYRYMPEIAYIYFKVRTRRVSNPLATIRRMVVGEQLDNNLTSIRDSFQKAYDLESHSDYSLEPDKRRSRLLVINIPEEQRLWQCPDISECKIPMLPADVKDMVRATWEILHSLGDKQIDDAIGTNMPKNI